MVVDGGVLEYTDYAVFEPRHHIIPESLLTYQRLYIRTAIAVVGGRVDRSKSTCLTPGGTLLTHSSSFSNMFSTGMVKLKTRHTTYTVLREDGMATLYISLEAQGPLAW